MTENKTYQSVVSEIDKLSKTLQVYDALIACGIAKKDVQYYDTPYIYSGYSMGETIHVKCNGKNIATVDNTKQYAKSCTWKPKHGLVVINFTKKELKEYVNYCKERANCNGMHQHAEEMRKLCYRAIDHTTSIIKNGYK